MERDVEARLAILEEHMDRSAQYHEKMLAFMVRFERLPDVVERLSGAVDDLRLINERNKPIISVVWGAVALLLTGAGAAFSAIIYR